MTSSLLEVNGHRYTYYHQSFPIPPVPLLSWLKTQLLFPKVYWAKRNWEGNCLQERVALGCLISFSSIPKLSQDSPPEACFYGGQNFMGGCRFWLPQIEIVQKGSDTLLHLHHIEDISPSSFTFDWESPSLPSQIHTPSEEEWEKLVQKALEACLSHSLKKVVLARKTHTNFASPIDPYLLLEQQKSQSHRATLFLFQGVSQNAFIGASPETLYTRQGEEIAIDALAGSAPRGPTPDLDEHYRSLLWNSRKDQREFAIVKNFIHRALKPLSLTMTWASSDRVVALTYVQHIYNQCAALLKKGISDAQILNALHPTPALGGFPRKKALNFIAQNEPFDRGWYGAPVGYLSSQEADIAVAIRSALIGDRYMQRFAGTGIVKGSIPQEEWKELNIKIKTWEVK